MFHLIFQYSGLHIVMKSYELQRDKVEQSNLYEFWFIYFFTYVHNVSSLI